MKTEAEKLKCKTAGRFVIGILLSGIFATSLTACQFRPMYTSDLGTVGGQGIALSGLSVAEVNSRTGQQVRNHLVFLLSGGSNPASPTHEVRLRVSDATTVLAARINESATGGQRGNTAGSVKVTASYEIYDFQAKKITHRGSRFASAAYDQTTQSFATSRAKRDAENRAAREVAEQLRFAIGSDLSKI